MKLSEVLGDQALFSAAEVARKAADGLRPVAIQSIIDEETNIFGRATQITVRNEILDTTKIPIENPTLWFKIPKVIVCYVDMEGSTKLSASQDDRNTAKIYRYFTNTAIAIFHKFESPYIDIKGDGVFALFDSDKVYTALASTVSFKTFVANEFSSKVKKMTELDVGGHFGIDQGTLLVRRLGLKAIKGRTDRQNEVWAGKPVNMAAKLASKSTGDTLLVSDRYYSNLKDEKATMSCGCNSDDGEPKLLWKEIDVSDDDRFNFDSALSLSSNWCSKHGKSYCKDLVKLDE